MSLRGSSPFGAKRHASGCASSKRAAARSLNHSRYFVRLDARLRRPKPTGRCVTYFQRRVLFNLIERRHVPGAAHATCYKALSRWLRCHGPSAGVSQLSREQLFPDRIHSAST
jgi:hypothetical protein